MILNTSFEGDIKNSKFRYGNGVQRFITQEGCETYQGGFVQDTYHGYGQYISNNVYKEPWSYEGMFQINNFHGYGVLSYADGTVFSGLFKKNKAFGPGVLCYPSGEMDVGVWEGSQLIRLCLNIPGVERLCYTADDRAQASVFKRLVRPSTPDTDVAQEIVDKMNHSLFSMENLAPIKDKLYSSYCHNPASYLFNKSLYKDYSNQQISDLRNVEEELMLQKKEGLDPSIRFSLSKINVNKVVHEDYDNETNSETKSSSTDIDDNRIIEEDVVLISWNNQSIIVDLMLHSYQFRRQECISDYDIGDILCNRRLVFARSGLKETACIEFLKAAAVDDPRQLLALLKAHELNINVMDSRGNSAFLFAVAHDCRNVIDVLTKLKCNINTVNDEGFNALTYTLSRYLVDMYNIPDWTSAFLPPIKEPKAFPGLEWMVQYERAIKKMTTGSKASKNSLGSMTSRKRWASLTSTKTELEDAVSTGRRANRWDCYLLDMRPEPVPRGSLRTSSKRRVEGPEANQSVFSRSTLSEGLAKIEETFFNLLNMDGIDVNGSVAPAPLVILAILTKKTYILEEVLRRGADPNARLLIEEGELTPLHFLAMSKPSYKYPEFARLLLKYGANPNLKSSPDYLRETWKSLLHSGRSGNVPEGLTPIHALILRRDISYAIGKQHLMDLLCILARCSNQNERFLGLTPIGLAIAFSKFEVVSQILKCSKVKLNKKFDRFWGNALTTTLRNLSNYNPLDSVYKIMNELVDYGANPLSSISLDAMHYPGNVIDFAMYIRQLYSGRKQRGSHHKRAMDEVLEFLKTDAKNRLNEYIKGRLVRTILDALESEGRAENLAGEFSRAVRNLRDWVPLEEIPQLFERNIKERGYTNALALVNGLLVLINFPQLVSSYDDGTPLDIRPKRRHPKTVMTDLRKSHEQTHNPSMLAFDDSEAEDHIAKFYSSNNVPPDVDTEGDKYDVCYNCLRSCIDDCMTCPMCGIVKFCSARCNIEDIRNHHSKHQCKLVFHKLDPEEWFLGPGSRTTELLGRLSKLKKAYQGMRFKDILMDKNEEKNRATGVSESHPGHRDHKGRDSRPSKNVSRYSSRFESYASFGKSVIYSHDFSDDELNKLKEAWDEKQNQDSKVALRKGRGAGKGNERAQKELTEEIDLGKKGKKVFKMKQSEITKPKGVSVEAQNIPNEERNDETKVGKEVAQKEEERVSLQKRLSLIQEQLLKDEVSAMENKTDLPKKVQEGSSSGRIDASDSQVERGVTKKDPHKGDETSSNLLLNKSKTDEIHGKGKPVKELTPGDVEEIVAGRVGGGRAKGLGREGAGGGAGEVGGKGEPRGGAEGLGGSGERGEGAGILRGERGGAQGIGRTEEAAGGAGGLSGRGDSGGGAGGVGGGEGRGVGGGKGRRVGGGEGRGIAAGAGIGEGRGGLVRGGRAGEGHGGGGAGGRIQHGGVAVRGPGGGGGGGGGRGRGAGPSSARSGVAGSRSWTGRGGSRGRRRSRTRVGGSKSRGEDRPGKKGHTAEDSLKELFPGKETTSSRLDLTAEPSFSLSKQLRAYLLSVSPELDIQDLSPFLAFHPSKCALFYKAYLQRLKPRQNYSFN